MGEQILRGVRNPDLYKKQPTEGEKALQQANQMGKLESSGKAGQAIFNDPNYRKAQHVALSDPVYQSNYGASKYDTGTVTSADDIQNQRAANQSNIDKLANGVAKAGITFLADLGNLTGFIKQSAVNLSLMATGNSDKIDRGVWDSDLGRAMDQFNNFGEKTFANYRSHNEEQNNFLENAFSGEGWANFWGDSVIKNFGFVYAGGAIMKGVSLLGKAFKAGELLEKGLSWGAKAYKASKAERLTMGAIKGMELGSNAIKGVNAASRVMSGLVSAGIGALGEGSYEAQNNANQWAGAQKQQLDAYYDKESGAIQQKYGNSQEGQRQMEILNQKFRDGVARIDQDRTKMGNTDMALNIPILTASNFLQFAKLFNGGWKTGEKYVNGIVKETAEEAAEKQAKLAAKAVGKEAAEGVTEGSQGWFSSLKRKISDKFGYTATKEAEGTAAEEASKVAQKSANTSSEEAAESALKTATKTGSTEAVKSAEETAETATKAASKDAAKAAESAGEKTLDDQLKWVKKEEDRGWLKKLLNAAWTYGKGPISEGNEEVLQQLASDIPGDYYNNDMMDFYNSKVDKNGNNTTASWLNSISTAIKEDLGKESTWEQFFVGAITGAMGIPGFHKNAEGKWRPSLDGGIVGAYKEEQSKRLRESKIISSMNEFESEARNSSKALFSGLIREQHYLDKQNEAIAKGDRFGFENSRFMQLASAIDAYANAGQLDALRTIIKSQSENLSDEDVLNIMKANQKTLNNGEVISPFTDENGNSLTTNQVKDTADLEDTELDDVTKANSKILDNVREQVAKRAKEMSDSIDDYDTIKGMLDAKTKDQLSDDAVSTFIAGKMAFNNYGKRVHQLANELNEPIQKILDRAHILNALEVKVDKNGRILKPDTTGMSEDEAQQANALYERAIKDRGELEGQKEAKTPKPEKPQELIDAETTDPNSERTQQLRDEYNQKLSEWELTNSRLNAAIKEIEGRKGVYKQDTLGTETLIQSLNSFMDVTKFSSPEEFADALATKMSTFYTNAQERNKKLENGEKVDNDPTPTIVHALYQAIDNWSTDENTKETLLRKVTDIGQLALSRASYKNLLNIYEKHPWLLETAIQLSKEQAQKDTDDKEVAEDADTVEASDNPDEAEAKLGLMAEESPEHAEKVRNHLKSKGSVMMNKIEASKAVDTSIDEFAEQFGDVFTKDDIELAKGFIRKRFDTGDEINTENVFSTDVDDIDMQPTEDMSADEVGALEEQKQRIQYLVSVAMAAHNSSEDFRSNYSTVSLSNKVNADVESAFTSLINKATSEDDVDDEDDPETIGDDDTASSPTTIEPTDQKEQDEEDNIVIYNELGYLKDLLGIYYYVNNISEENAETHKNSIIKLLGKGTFNKYKTTLQKIEDSDSIIESVKDLLELEQELQQLNEGETLTELLQLIEKLYNPKLEEQELQEEINNDLEAFEDGIEKLKEIISDREEVSSEPIIESSKDSNNPPAEPQRQNTVDIVKSTLNRLVEDFNTNKLPNKDKMGAYDVIRAYKDKGIEEGFKAFIEYAKATKDYSEEAIEQFEKDLKALKGTAAQQQVENIAKTQLPLGNPTGVIWQSVKQFNTKFSYDEDWRNWSSQFTSNLGERMHEVLSTANKTTGLNAFDFINQGKLKVGDKVMLRPYKITFQGKDNKKATNTLIGLYVATSNSNDPQLVNFLPNSLVQTLIAGDSKNFRGIIDYIENRYVKNNPVTTTILEVKNGLFRTIFSPTHKVQEKDQLNSISNVVNGKVIFGVVHNGDIHILDDKVDPKDIIPIQEKVADGNGRIVYYTKASNGKWYPHNTYQRINTLQEFSINDLYKAKDGTILKEYANTVDKVANTLQTLMNTSFKNLTPKEITDKVNEELNKINSDFYKELSKVLALDTLGSKSHINISSKIDEKDENRLSIYATIQKDGGNKVFIPLGAISLKTGDTQFSSVQYLWHLTQKTDIQDLDEKLGLVAGNVGTSYMTYQLFKKLLFLRLSDLQLHFNVNEEELKNGNLNRYEDVLRTFQMDKYPVGSSFEAASVTLDSSIEPAPVKVTPAKKVTITASGMTITSNGKMYKMSLPGTISNMKGEEVTDPTIIANVRMAILLNTSLGQKDNGTVDGPELIYNVFDNKAIEMSAISNELTGRVFDRSTNTFMSKDKAAAFIKDYNQLVKIPQLSALAIQDLENKQSRVVTVSGRSYWIRDEKNPKKLVRYSRAHAFMPTIRRSNFNIEESTETVNGVTSYIYKIVANPNFIPDRSNPSKEIINNITDKWAEKYLRDNHYLTSTGDYVLTAFKENALPDGTGIAVSVKIKSNDINNGEESDWIEIPYKKGVKTQDSFNPIILVAKPLELGTFIDEMARNIMNHEDDKVVFSEIGKKHMTQKGFDEAVKRLKRLRDSLEAQGYTLIADERTLFGEYTDANGITRKVAGTTDLIAWNKETGEIVILDYKTHGSSYYNSEKKEFTPSFLAITSHKWNKNQVQSYLNYYTNQLNIYKQLFDKYANGATVSSLILIPMYMKRSEAHHNLVNDVPTETDLIALGISKKGVVSVQTQKKQEEDDNKEPSNKGPKDSKEPSTDKSSKVKYTPLDTVITEENLDSILNNLYEDDVFGFKTSTRESYSRLIPKVGKFNGPFPPINFYKYKVGFGLEGPKEYVEFNIHIQKSTDENGNLVYKYVIALNGHAIMSILEKKDLVGRTKEQVFEELVIRYKQEARKKDLWKGELDKAKEAFKNKPSEEEEQIKGEQDFLNLPINEQLEFIQKQLNDRYDSQLISDLYMFDTTNGEYNRTDAKTFLEVPNQDGDPVYMTVPTTSYLGVDNKTYTMVYFYNPNTQKVVGKAIDMIDAYRLAKDTKGGGIQGKYDRLIYDISTFSEPIEDDIVEQEADKEIASEEQPVEDNGLGSFGAGMFIEGDDGLDHSGDEDALQIQTTIAQIESSDNPYEYYKALAKSKGVNPVSEETFLATSDKSDLIRCF